MVDEIAEEDMENVSTTFVVVADAKELAESKELIKLLELEIEKLKKK